MFSPHKTLTVIATIILTFTPSESANTWWMEQPYQSSEEFNSQLEYEDNGTLYCNDSRGISPSDEYQFVEWIRPDLKVMKNGDSDSFITLDGMASWYVENDEMHVVLVQEEHFGFYYCRLDSVYENYTMYVKKAINYNGPYFGDLWEKYEMNVIIGCSAAGGFLLICLICFLVHHFFFSDDDDDDDVVNDEIADGEYLSSTTQPGVSVVTNGTSYRGMTNGGYSVSGNSSMDVITGSYEQDDTQL